MRRGFKPKKEVKEASIKPRNYGCHNKYFLLIISDQATKEYMCVARHVYEYTAEI